ncbi:hypothetical protein [Aquibacillus kalidii]|uniref:hypothetical protein n=1 Tax=Aquibacillus kalidii TaxID=2762597 RepID=UPI0016482819|nr:hypothetical protein [Aquibacillus kalidii]
MRDNQKLYLNMILGEFGNTLILLCVVKAIWEPSSIAEFYLLFFGLVLSTKYTNYLEKLVGLSKKFIMIKLSVFLLVLLLSIIIGFNFR